MEKKCLLHGILCIEFAISSKLRDKINPDNRQNDDNDIEIKPVSAKFFFWIVRQKDHKVYI